MARYAPAPRNLWAEFLYCGIGAGAYAARTAIRVFWAAADLPSEFFSICTAVDPVRASAVDSSVAGV